MFGVFALSVSFISWFSIFKTNAGEVLRLKRRELSIFSLHLTSGIFVYNLKNTVTKKIDLYTLSLNSNVFKLLFEKQVCQNYLGEMWKMLYINTKGLC